ncbi:MAG: FkbM family methyltransferase [Rhodobacteraceae bacterium]|nr:FkbM family methyltransferase [Paracoccaceae bacterium]
MLASWGVVATVKEEAATIRSFVAHYKTLGADEIHLYFDDPDDPAAALAEAVPGVRVTRCGADHWKGHRPDTHQARQKHNANRAYRRCRADWLIHLDADELLHSALPIGRVLGGLDRGQVAARVMPAEAMVPPRRSEGLSVFRLPLPDNARGRRIGEKVYGELNRYLERGFLSHTAGKCFVRTGRADVVLSIHDPFVGGVRVTPPWLPDTYLLHLHGDDEERWLAAVGRRLTTGAYQAKFHDDRRRARRGEGPGRNAYLTELMAREGEAGLRRFFRQVCVFDATKAPLRRFGLILKLRLWLPEKVETWFPGTHAVAARRLAVNPQTGCLEAEAESRGSRMIVSLQDNYTEAMIARGTEAEAEELDAIIGIVAGRQVVFWDVGANAGVYSLAVARHAAPESVIVAFEPNPVMAARFLRNVALNGYRNIRLEQVALGEGEGETRLVLHANLGQASPRADAPPEAGASIAVPLRELAPYVMAAPRGALNLLKIDIEGAEPACLGPFFARVPPTHWPDVVLFEHAHADRWGIAPEALFPGEVYRIRRRFRHNTLLERRGPAA